MAIIFLVIGIIVVAIINAEIKEKKERQYKELSAEALNKLGFSNWGIISYFDENITVKSRQTLEKYDDIEFFRRNPEKLKQAESILKNKKDVADVVKTFIENNEFKTHPQYQRLKILLDAILKSADAYRIKVTYLTSAGNNLGTKEIAITQYNIDKFKKDPSLLLSKAELNQRLKEQQKEAVSKKQREYYEHVNEIIDYANNNKDFLVIKKSKEQLDNIIAQLFDRTINSIKKIKVIDSEEWDVLERFIIHKSDEVKRIVRENQKILAYYDSADFLKIKDTCEVLMSSQREFNEYITEKVQSISQLFGTRVIRNETNHEDAYNYIRPYKKTITPFTAEVSAAVFSSAENNPLEYIVKYFYPNKSAFPKQIQKLSTLVEELQTLKEAKQIIENYKKEYQQYLCDVPAFIMENDEEGFYSRLGFATIDESVLAVEYKFSYTSGGGMAQRSFSVPMTEETIAELIELLESKLTAAEFVKEQRNLMTKKLRDHIKTRDNFTCCTCGNSTHIEPNLLLEIDHIIPVAKGGCTIEANLQTLCWKCNRAKSDKIIA